MKSLPGKRFLKILGCIVAAGAVLRVAWIGSQAPTTDDAEVVWTASNYVLHGQPMPTMPFHPVLRNLLVYVSTQAFGTGWLGVKGLSVLFGTLLIAVTALLVRRAARDDRAALFAAGLVAVDVVMIDYSRQAVQEIPAAFFTTLGVWFVVEALWSDGERRWRWLVPAAGVVFGLAVACKFYAIPPLLLSVALLGYSAWRRRKVDDGLLVGAAMVPLPFLVHLLTYVPWFGRGYSLTEWVRFQAACIESMLTHTRPAIGAWAFNEPALWFLQPFYGFVDVAMSTNGVQASVAVGNPLVWLAVLPAAAYSLVTPAQRRRDGLLLAFFAVTYLPLVFATRPVWLLSSVAVFPFAAGVLGSVAAALSRRLTMRVVWVYAFGVVVTSLLLYPLAIGRALEFGYLRPIVDHMGDPGTAGAP